jgi:Phytanoyl-CoA dioxygenase (PhyH)
MRLSLKRRRDADPEPQQPQQRRHPEPPAKVAEYEPVESADPLAEIAELMSANRANPDPATEKRIVQLRHEAFAQLERGVTPPGPQARPGAALPTPDGLPEVDASELTADSLRDGIVGGGSLLIRGLVDPERAERMRAGIDRTFEQRDALMQGASVAETTPWFDPFAPSPDYPPDAAQWNRMKLGGHAVWAPDSPRMMFELLDAFDETGLTGLVTDYLGERPALSMNKSVLRRVSPESGTDWHQDGAFLGGGIRTCNVWIALSRCGDVAPGLDIVARRYDEIVETGTEGAVFPWAVSPQMVEETREGAAIARPVFEAGDALLFDHYCLHRTAVDPAMTEDRYATETWCFSPSVYPDKTVPLVL